MCSYCQHGLRSQLNRKYNVAMESAVGRFFCFFSVLYLFWLTGVTAVLSANSQCFLVFPSLHSHRFPLIFCLYVGVGTASSPPLIICTPAFHHLITCSKSTPALHSFFSVALTITVVNVSGCLCCSKGTIHLLHCIYLTVSNSPDCQSPSLLLQLPASCIQAPSHASPSLFVHASHASPLPILTPAST